MLIGHATILDDLRSRIAHDRFPASNLFVGIPSVGKFTCARVLAAEMVGDVHSPDFIIIDTHGEPITIGAIRDLEHTLSVSSVTDTRVVVIRNIELLRAEAAHAFLKTLEEPPANTHFILTCDRPESLLDTIRSRTSIFGFSLPSLDVLRRGLFDLGYTGIRVDEVLKLPISPTAGEAITLLENDKVREEVSSFEEQYKRLLDGMDLHDAFALAESLAAASGDAGDARARVVRFLRGFITFARIEVLAGRSPEASLSRIIRMLDRAAFTNVNLRLLLEEGFMNLLF